MMDDLMYYNIEYWCKIYFNTGVKCDFVDNNIKLKWKGKSVISIRKLQEMSEQQRKKSKGSSSNSPSQSREP
ncbi:hypothetical protein H5410_016271 [Solanum commersonii]|uniref:Uncharacterized protein n=1 Tax=Solanum commersonii TaxID=4109 RepID=A0A9J5ZX41_SOLCO|nr:hypothetical protein H5410_016271 [Solanum commersonii]